jgi:EAL domain-containing protein (putative c-di-GMP-specific phosphodiesterase class I)
VTNVATDGRDHAIVRSIVTLAHDLGLQVLAEGVETGDVLERLRLLDCDQAQGYHLSRPLPGPDLLRWLAREGGSAVVAA